MLDEKFKRLKDESDEAYQIRLTLMKQDGIDIDWSEIAELVGDGRSSESYRKDSYGIKRMNKAIQQEKLKNSDNEELDKLNEKLKDIKKEKVKLNDLRTLVNKETRELARVENIYDLFKEEINNLNKEKPLLGGYYENKETSINQGLLMISDFHYGLKINNHLNKYDIDIAKERLKKVTDDTIEYCEMHNVSVLNIYFLGDLISGNIRTIIKLQNQIDLSKQIIYVSELLSEMICILSNKVPRLTISYADGNHCRTEDKLTALDSDNFTFIIKEHMKLRLKDVDNVEFQENKYGNEIIYSEILGYSYVGTHGHLVKKGKIAYQLEKMIKEKVDYALLGHFHEDSTKVEYESKVYINGSICGTDMYAKSLMLHTKPCQKLLILNQDGVLCEYTIRF